MHRLASLLSSLAPPAPLAGTRPASGELHAPEGFEALLLALQGGAPPAPASTLPIAPESAQGPELRPDAALEPRASAENLPPRERTERREIPLTDALPALADPPPPLTAHARADAGEQPGPADAAEPPRSPEGPSSPPALGLAPSLLSLVLGTAEGTRPAPTAGEADAAVPNVPPRTPAPESLPVQARAQAELHARDLEPLSFPVLSAEEAAAAHAAVPAEPRAEASEIARPQRGESPRPALHHAQPPAEIGAARAGSAEAAVAASSPSMGDETPTSGERGADSAARGVAPAAVSAEPSAPRDTTPAASPGRALPELPARGEHEIVHSVRVLAHEGGGRVQIRLDPPELGGLSLRVVVSDGAAHVSLVAEHAPVADLLGRHSAELRGALEALGVRLEQLEIGAGDVSLDSGDARPRERADEREASGPAGTPLHARSALPRPGRLDVSTLGAVDVLV